MRAMRNVGQCHPCTHLRRCDSLDGTAGGGARGHEEMCRGEGGLCCTSVPVPLLLEFRSTIGSKAVWAE